MQLREFKSNRSFGTERVDGRGEEDSYKISCNILK
jgi:hypothetical protein